MPESLFLFATIVPKPDHLVDAREAVLGIVPATLEEPGCRAFALMEGEEDGRLYLSEEWRDDEALQAHYAMHYTRAVLEKYRDWLAEPVTVLRLRRAA